MAAVGETEKVFTPLLGTDDAIIDSKGRILLGKKQRDRLGDTFAMAIGELGCICVYPEDRWQERLREINSSSPINQGRRQYTEMFLEFADDGLSCDAQGRVTIPRVLREEGKLTDKVLLRGVFDHLQIWDPEEHAKYRNNPETYSKDRRLVMEQAYEKMKGG